MSNTGKWLAMKNHQSSAYPQKPVSNGSLKGSSERLAGQPRKRKATTERNNTSMSKKPKISTNNNRTKLRAAMRTCRRILTKLLSKNHRAIAWPFYCPVNAEAQGLWNYHEIIKKPMDLGTILKKIDAGIYGTPIQFADDVRLMFANCYCYNPPDHEVVAMGKALEKIFETEFDKIPAEFSKITFVPVGEKCVNNLNDSTDISRKSGSSSTSSSGSDSGNESSAESSDSDSNSYKRRINVNKTKNDCYNSSSDSKADVDVKSVEFLEVQNHFQQCELKLAKIVEVRRMNQRHQQNLKNDLNNNKNKAKNKRDSTEESARLVEAQNHLYQGTMKLAKYLNKQQIKGCKKFNNTKKALNSKKQVTSTVVTKNCAKNLVQKTTRKVPVCAFAPADSTKNDEYSFSDRQILACVTSNLPEDKLAKVARLICSMEPNRCEISSSEDLEVDFSVIKVSTLKSLQRHFVLNFPELYAQAQNMILRKKTARASIDSEEVNGLLGLFRKKLTLKRIKHFPRFLRIYSWCCRLATAAVH